MGLHAGVLGTGDWCRVHLEALTASPHVERVTLAGRNQAALSKLAAQFPAVSRTLPSHEPLLGDPSVDLVHVVLPHDMHAARSIEALSAGKHVICEKPAATNLADFDRVVDTAIEHRRRFLVVMNQLYNPVYRRVRELVEAGAVGRPFLSVENSYSRSSKNYRNVGYWRNTVDRAGGGVLLDGGFHMVYRHLDTLASYGPPTWVLADAPQLAVSDDGSRVSAKGEDFVSAVVGFEGPLRIQWAHGWTLAATPERARQSFLAGTEGTFELTDRDEDAIVIHRPAQEPLAESPAGPRTGAETTRACVLDYLAAIASGRQPENGTLAQCRLALATIMAVYTSGRSGRRELLK